MCITVALFTCLPGWLAGGQGREASISRRDQDFLREAWGWTGNLLATAQGLEAKIGDATAKAAGEEIAAEQTRLRSDLEQLAARKGVDLGGEGNPTVATQTRSNQGKLSGDAGTVSGALLRCRELARKVDDPETSVFANQYEAILAATQRKVESVERGEH